MHSANIEHVCTNDFGGVFGAYLGGKEKREKRKKKGEGKKREEDSNSHPVGEIPRKNYTNFNKHKYSFPR